MALAKSPPHMPAASVTVVAPPISSCCLLRPHSRRRAPVLSAATYNASQSQLVSRTLPQRRRCVRICSQLTETEQQAARVGSPPQSSGARSAFNGSDGRANFRIDLAGLKKLTDAPAGEVYDTGVVESAQVLQVACLCCRAATACEVYVVHLGMQQCIALHKCG